MRARLLALLLLIAAPAFAAQTAQQWIINPAASTLTYKSGNQDMTIGNFTASINFDPNALAGSALTIVADISSLAGPPVPPEVQKIIGQRVNPESITPGAGSAAVFTSSSISKGAYNEFTANGTLTIGQVAHPLSIPLTASLGKDSRGVPTLTLQGQFMTQRSEYSFGDAGQQKAENFSNDVPVSFVINATLPE